MYSFRISFLNGPRRTARGVPRASAGALYRASRSAAVALIVMLVLTPRRNGGSPGTPIGAGNASAVGSWAATKTGMRAPLCVRPWATGDSAAADGALGAVRGRLRFARAATGEGS